MTKMIKEIFGKISKLRESRGWSTHELAEKANMHQPTLWRLETDQITAVGRLDEYIEKISKAFGLTVDQFVGKDDNLNHLTPEVQRFVLDPSNADFIRKLWLEHELQRLNEKKGAQQ